MKLFYLSKNIIHYPCVREYMYADMIHNHTLRGGVCVTTRDNNTTNTTCVCMMSDHDNT